MWPARGAEYSRMCSSRGDKFARDNTLQHTATHCNTLQHSATHCSTLQLTNVHTNMCSSRGDKFVRDLLIQMKVDRTSTPKDTATHCNTLQHTATYCITLWRSTAHCITVQYSDIFTMKYRWMKVNMSFVRTGWRRLIGSSKLQINFHKRAIKYRSFLRKMTYKDKGSYESSPPCNVSIIRNNMTWFNPSFLRIRTVCLLVHAYTHEGESVLRS